MKLLAALLLAISGGVHADDAPIWSKGWSFDQRDGAAIYAALCAGCHMPDGRGAQGAGSYPALAGNAKLASTAYLLTLVLYGNKAMPALGGQLDDAQVAAVAGYVRGRFGGIPDAAVATDDVKALRH
nr:cytochrome c [uncultured Roseateles sp.]